VRDSDILRRIAVGAINYIFKPLCYRLLVVAAALSGTVLVFGQTKGAAEPNATLAERGIALAAKGRCKEALPLLKKSGMQLADQDLKYDVLMSTARCAMSLEQFDAAVKALVELNRAFPHDPEVLFMSTHYYTAIASKAAQELASAAPTSAQAEQLEAEAFESQGDWDKAVAEYRKILDEHPKREGIHYRL